MEAWWKRVRGGDAACQSNDMWSWCAGTTVSPVGLSGQQASAGKLTGDQYRFFHLAIFGSLSRMLYHPCMPAYLALSMISGKSRHGRSWPLAFRLFSGKIKKSVDFFSIPFSRADEVFPRSLNCLSKFFDQKSKQLHLFVQARHNARNSFASSGPTTRRRREVSTPKELSCYVSALCAVFICLSLSWCVWFYFYTRVSIHFSSSLILKRRRLLRLTQRSIRVRQ